MERFISNSKLLQSHSIYDLLTGLSFEEGLVKHKARLAVKEYAPIVEEIRKTVLDTRESFYEKDKSGKIKKDADGNPIWKEGGEEEAKEKNIEFLNKKIKVRCFIIKEEWLSPAWRYVPTEKDQPVTRESYFFSGADLEAISFALIRTPITVSESELEEALEYDPEFDEEVKEGKEEEDKVEEPKAKPEPKAKN